MHKNTPEIAKRLRRVRLSLAVWLLAGLLLPAARPAAAQTGSRGEAIVLVNDTSPHYADFQRLIKPYLDHLGVPYTVLNVHSASVSADIGSYALIVTGHRLVDPTGSDLDAAEEDLIVAAVAAGTGLVNLDNALSADGQTGRYEFVQAIFGFGYQAPAIDWSVTVVGETPVPGTVVDCTDDAHQQPVLTTITSTVPLTMTDGLWTEYVYPPRPVKAVFATVDDATQGLPVLRCYAGGLANGTYDLTATLYTAGFQHRMRYYYGYSPAQPKQFSVDTEGGSGGNDRFSEYSLGTVSITDGSLSLYVQDADSLASTQPITVSPALADLYAQDLDLSLPVDVDPWAGPTRAQGPYLTVTDTLSLFGWSSIRLTPAGTPPPAMHYIAARHPAGDWIGTGSMTMPGIGPLPPDVQVVARSSSEPLLMVTSHGAGRAVQWGSYDWMSHAVKGPMYSLDDLVWRSLVWAARKPFVMQGMPPFLTMRVDDESGPFNWVHTANEFGFKPWVGLFYNQVDATEAADLSDLVHAGQATASVHAKRGDLFFYYDHLAGNLPDATQAGNYTNATAWHASNNIPISKVVVPHYYEIGTNAFQGLRDWGVEFVTVTMPPGAGYGSPWIQNGPFRLHETGDSAGGYPLYYADWLEVPGHPEFANQFFNCATEVRDDTGYEWFPGNDVVGSIGRGTRQARRALDNMAVPVLVTHGPYISLTTPENWRAILQGITGNLAPYGAIPVTVDYACQYARAMRTSSITSASFNPTQGRLSLTMGGSSDMPTQLYLFTEWNGSIRQTAVNVPAFSASTTLSVVIQAPTGYQVFLPLVEK